MYISRKFILYLFCVMILSVSVFLLIFQIKYLLLSSFQKESYSSFRTRETTCYKCFVHNFTYVINNMDICSPANKHLDLFILIFSHQQNQDRRNAIRKTWLFFTKQNTANVRYAFMLGEASSNALHINIVAESETYYDIVQENFNDTYTHLTQKSIMGFKWIVNYCANAKYILKTDDDMFINIPNILHYLYSNGEVLTTTIVGACTYKSVPIRDKQSKWYASKMSYGEQLYPGYCSGTGYLTSFNVVKQIYLVSESVPFFHLEDIYIGICLFKIGGTVLNKEGFNSGRVHLDPCLYKGNTLLTSHRLTSEMLTAIWEEKCVSA